MKLLVAVTLALLLLATSAEATTVTAEASLDWRGFAYTTTGTLQATLIDPAYNNIGTWTSGVATASAVNGMLSATASAVAVGAGDALGVAGADAASVFWFYGTGSGSLVVTLPYHLALSAVATSEYDIMRASAQVGFYTGPGVGSNEDWFATSTLTLLGAGSASVDGVLSASEPLVNPYWGPLVSFDAAAATRAYAAVPETTSPLLLLSLGVLALGVPAGARAARRR